ncbi:MAG: ATP-binding protein [Desulfobacteraceae bacterium]
MTLPESIRTHLGDWLIGQCVFGYVLLDSEGRVVAWGGALDQLGIGPLQEGKEVGDQLIFTQGLIPTDEPSIHLPMIKLDERHTLDLLLFREDDAYALLLLEAEEKQQQLAKYQQKANELALWREQQSGALRSMATTSAADTLERFFKACNVAALELDTGNHFSLIGQAPDWLNRFCPEAAIRPCNLSPENVFSFLENFLNEAYDFWDQHKIGCIKSGVWIEKDASGKEHLFEATAVYTGASKILLIFNENKHLAEKRALIQRGRELALGHCTLEKSQTRMQLTREALEARVKERTLEIEQAKKRLEEELIQRQTLESERTEMILQLQQAQKMEAIGTLAGGIAHDFNNILSAVVGFTELSLFDVPKDSTLASNLKQVLSAAQRAKALIGQILTFSRQTTPEIRPVQMEMIIQEALKLLRASLPPSVEIKQDLQSHAYVMADPTQLHQVVMNLCTNAGQAMVTEGGILEIGLQDKEIGAEDAETHKGLAPGSYLEMTVRDSGYGMTTDTMDRIFDPFFTTKEKGEGTGMGLAVVHGIVANCRGDISVSSQVGEGTTFRVILPTVKEIEMPEDVIPAALPKGNESILFIDDEPMQTDLALKILTPLGYHVTAMTDSAAALKTFIDSPDSFDIVVTDMYMPKVTGKGFAIEALRIRPNIPIILCSGYSVNLVDPNSMEQYFKGHLMKPFLIKEMATTIRNVLDGHS